MSTNKKGRYPFTPLFVKRWLNLVSMLRYRGYYVENLPMDIQELTEMFGAQEKVSLILTHSNPELNMFIRAIVLEASLKSISFAQISNITKPYVSQEALNETKSVTVTEKGKKKKVQLQTTDDIVNDADVSNEKLEDLEAVIPEGSKSNTRTTKSKKESKVVIQRILLFSDSAPSPEAKALIKSLNSNIDPEKTRFQIEFFVNSYFNVSIKDIRLQPKVEILNKQQEQLFLDSIETDSALENKKVIIPHISNTEAMARYLGLMAGDIIKITRKIPRLEVTYRSCVPEETL